MIESKSVLAIVPARGGSKGLPGKNKRLLQGKPLVAWPIGKKGCKGVDFTKIGLREMMDPAYRQKLAEGNIGVVQGEPSGRVGSFDIDGPGSEEFLTLNPDFKETLRTKGARGCNIWFYPEGDVPRSCL